MKKAIFSIMTVLLLVSTVAFSQMTNTEIYQIIQKSREANLANGVLDPNDIWPGQTLTFDFLDGYLYKIEVQKGDVQWNLVKEIDELINQHGPIVSHDTAIQQQITPVPVPEPIEWHWWDSALNIGLLLALFCALVILAKLMHIRYRNRRRNPVTAGIPQVSGGVRNANAYSRMQEVAQNRYPGAQIEIKNIRRGWLSGLANVFYADGKSKKLQLKDVAAYAGEARINGREQTIYFLQGCGNDARQGNYMAGDLEFRPDVVINQDGSESPLPEETTKEELITETLPNEEPKQTIVNPGSETHQRKMKVLEILTGELGNSELHEVLIEEAADGGFKAQIKYKYEPKRTSKSSVEKKEEK